MGWRLVAIGLLLSVAAGSLSLPARALESAQPAGCHFHAGPRSSLQPTDHACCQSGHDAALTEARLADLPRARCAFAGPAAFRICPGLPLSRMLSGGPPLFPPRQI